METLHDKNILLLFVALVFIIISYGLLSNSFKSRKHRRNISTGERVILKMKSFQGQYKNQQILTYLRKISPYVFEELILSALINKGFQVKRNKSYSGDGGLDGMFFYNNKTFLIQAKRYSNTVKTQHLIEFSDLVKSKKAHCGYFVHTGKTV